MSKVTNDFRELPEEEQKKYISLVINIIVSANHTIFQIEQLKHKPAWIKELKNYGNLFLTRLMKIERDFDMIASGNDNMTDIYDDFHDFMAAVNTVPIPEMRRYANIIRATNKSPDSLTGIAKKVLKES